jgi:hypothetical protein
MAHADIFERISRKDIANQETNFIPQAETTKEPQLERKAIETIKLLGKQILEIREIIDQQTKTIKSLQKEVVSLRKKGEETDGNVKLAMIDQKDVSNQLRTLKAAVNSHEYIDSRMPSREAYNQAPRQMPQALPQSIQRQMPQSAPQAQRPVQQPVQRPIQQPVSRAIQETKAAAQYQNQAPVRTTAASAAEMNSAYEEITTAINQARSQLGLEPHPDLLGSITKEDKVYPTREAENVAKNFIFGRIPKMLNLS